MTPAPPGSGHDPTLPWPRIKALFDALADRPPAERAAVLAQAELAPAALAQLQALLQHHDLAGGTQGDFLAEPAAQRLTGSAATVGQRLGDWQVLRSLGGGGMGEVFEARRADGSYDGLAAIKLLRRGMDSAAVLARFAQERQALARLNHPHIARLLDAGLSEQGQPYFVMEHVLGQTIAQACTGRSLDQRLQLFLQLADAVAHAHARLLVHRDLKPGNVLVDGDGQVKLLDFGIAKALDPLEPLADPSMEPGGAEPQATLGGVRPYTPHYASPEQVRGEGVGTATDIYSLGVLLYEMLTGARPTGRTATTAAEAARGVLHETPRPPSSLSPTEVPDNALWLAQRKKLQGDLDAVLLKALEKSPERRYSSVEALAADVQRFRQGFPVSARPARWTDRFGKLLRRQPLASLAWALGGLAVVAGTLGVAWQGQVARQAQRLAESRLQEVRRVTHELVFSFGDTIEYLPGGMQIKADLYQATLAALQRLVPTLGGDEATLADIAQVHVRLAEAHAPGYPVSLNQLATARGHAQAAVALVEQLWPKRQAEPAFAGYASRAYSVLASVQGDDGQAEQAVLSVRRGLAMAQQALKAAPPGSPTLMLRSGITASSLALAIQLDDNGVGTGDHVQAMALYQAARASALQELAMTAEMAALDAKSRRGHTAYEAELRQTLGVINGSMSSSFVRRGDSAAALAARSEAVAHLRRAQAMHPEQVQLKDSLATSLRQLTLLQLQLGDAAAALASSTENQQLMAALLATDAKNTEWLDSVELATLAHGTALAQLGQHQQALPWLTRGLAYWRAEADKKPPKADQPASRAQRNAAIAEHRLRRSSALAMSTTGGRAAAWAAVQASAEPLRALAQRPPPNAETWLFLAEAEHSLAHEGLASAAQRQQHQQAACAAWAQSAALRPLPPAVLPLRAAGCG